MWIKVLKGRRLEEGSMATVISQDRGLEEVPVAMGVSHDRGEDD